MHLSCLPLFALDLDLDLDPLLVKSCDARSLFLCGSVVVYGVWCGQDAVVWSIKQFNGSQEYLMRAHFGLPSISAEDAREWKAPIQVLVHYSSIVMYRVCKGGTPRHHYCTIKFKREREAESSTRRPLVSCNRGLWARTDT